MKKLRVHGLIIGFLMLICLPAIDQIVGISSMKTMENREGFHIDGHGFGKLKSLIKQLNAYYNSSFGWRNELVYIYNILNYDVLNESPIPEQVVLGKDGWLFAGDHSGNVIKQHMGLLPLKKDSALAIAIHLEKVRQQLAERGIKLYVLIAPDSHSIYPEALPDRLSVCRTTQVDKSGNHSPKTPLDELTLAMKQQPTVSYLDLRDTLLKSKSAAPLYYKTDTHWNSYGALIGCAALVKKMRQDFPQLIPVSAKDYTYERGSAKGGDLAGLMMLSAQLRETQVYEPYRKTSLSCTQTKVITEPSSGYATTWLKGADSMQPSLLFFGDSFSLAMMPNLPAYFSESCFVRQSTLDWKRIDAQKPDAVVVEIVERNLRALSRL